MDRYIIRNPQPSTSGSSKGNKPRMKQATIESLKGVVVIEDILHHKARLKLPTSSKDEKIKSLQELGKKIPPRHVLLETKIGRIINKLRTDDDEDIRKAAKTVYVKWKSFFVNHAEKPMFEVQCDLRTEKTRKSGKKLLAEALELQNSHKLPDTIERETFHIFKRLISNSYKRTIRHLVFTLKNKREIREKVISGEITVTDFVVDNKRL